MGRLWLNRDRRALIAAPIFAATGDTDDANGIAAQGELIAGWDWRRCYPGRLRINPDVLVVDRDDWTRVFLVCEAKGHAWVNFVDCEVHSGYSNQPVCHAAGCFTSVRLTPWDPSTKAGTSFLWLGMSKDVREPEPWARRALTERDLRSGRGTPKRFVVSEPLRSTGDPWRGRISSPPP